MRRWVMVAMVVLMGVVVSAQDVKVDFDKNADFSGLSTFNVKIGTSWNNSISEERMTEAFERALAGKGWKKVSVEPDATVVLHGATDLKKSLDTFYTDMGGYGGYGWRGWGGGGVGTATTTVHEYTVGTLVVDIFDTKTKKLVFRGTASDEISNKQEKNAKKVEKATKKMFKEFPPTAENAK